MSSYGEVQLHKFIAESKQQNEPTESTGGFNKGGENIQTYDQSVSLVKMQDSMNFEDFKAAKKGA